MKKTFIVCQEHLRKEVNYKFEKAFYFSEGYVKQMFLRFIKETWKYRPKQLIRYVYDLNRLPNKEYWKTIFAISGAKKKLLMDSFERIEKASLPGALFFYIPEILAEISLSPFIFRRHLKNLHKSEKTSVSVKAKNNKNDKRRILFLRTDFAFGLIAGGSVAHLNGVVKGFKDNGFEIIFVSNDRIPMIEEKVNQLHLLELPRFFRNVPEVWALEFNNIVISYCRNLIERYKPGILYQRYSLNNYSGLQLARRFNIPFVLEYNGSEVWIGKSWGRGLKFPEFAEEIEIANLKGADLIVVVSEVMKEELVERGIPERKILVNPNGYDEELFNPELDGSEIRKKFGLEGKIVIGFIGTFGKWHGAEVLAKSAKEVVEKIPNAHFLFIGDGMTKPEAERIVRESGISASVTFTGLISQKEAPKYLAACDILVAPHVQNPDGTEFFGSPTKLFEYMGTGKAIVASAVGQMGKIIKNEFNGLTVEPGNVASLSSAIIRLATEENFRKKLRENAFSEAREKYTWNAHTKRILNRLSEEGIIS